MTSTVIQPLPPRLTMSRTNSVSSLKTMVAPEVEFASDKSYAFYGSEKVGGDAPQAGAPFTFSQKEIAQILGSLFDSLKKSATEWVIFYNPLKNADVHLKNACLTQNKLRITYPALPTVEAEPVQAELSIPDNQLGTEQLLEKVLEGLPETNELLNKYQELLDGAASKEEKTLCEDFNKYQIKLASLKGWFQGAESVKSGILLDRPESLPSAYFMAEQLPDLENKVDSLSELASIITKSRESLCKLPSLDDIRFSHGLVVGVGYFASSFVLFTGGMAIPWIGFCAASASVVGLIGIYGYVKYKQYQAKKWKERIDIDEIHKFTKQLEKLKESAVLGNVANLDRVAVNHTNRLDRLENLVTENHQLVEELRVTQEKAAKAEAEKEVAKAEKEAAEAKYQALEEMMLARMDAMIEAKLSEAKSGTRFGSSPPQAGVPEAPKASNTGRRPNTIFG